MANSYLKVNNNHYSSHFVSSKIFNQVNKKLCDSGNLKLVYIKQKVLLKETKWLAKLCQNKRAGKTEFEIITKSRSWNMVITEMYLMIVGKQADVKMDIICWRHFLKHNPENKILCVVTE